MLGVIIIALNISKKESGQFPVIGKIIEGHSPSIRVITKNDSGRLIITGNGEIWSGSNPPFKKLNIEKERDDIDNG